LSSPFQNRLVGTIIIAAVVIIFLPDVLDGEKKTHQTDFEAIPNAPIFSGKLTNKNFPEDQLRKKSVETIIAEEAQDHLLTNSIDNEVSKITPANKNKINDDVTATNKTVNTEKTVSGFNSPVNKVIEPLPEKAVAKEAWVIHLGSFKHKQNVAQLLAKLKSNGYSTFTQPIKTKQGTLTKVFVGPELIKSSLDKKLPALKKLTNATGKVARFYPNK